jgi:transcriptional regulator with XRE-family HTH domain
MTGAELRAFRKNLGLSDRGLARAIGLSDTSDGSTIRKWERDAVPVPLWVETLIAMADEVNGVREWLRERGY